MITKQEQIRNLIKAKDYYIKKHNEECTKNNSPYYNRCWINMALSIEKEIIEIKREKENNE